MELAASIITVIAIIDIGLDVITPGFYVNVTLLHLMDTNIILFIMYINMFITLIFLVFRVHDIFKIFLLSLPLSFLLLM